MEIDENFVITSDLIHSWAYKYLPCDSLIKFVVKFHSWTCELRWIGRTAAQLKALNKPSNSDYFTPNVCIEIQVKTCPTVDQGWSFGWYSSHCNVASCLTLLIHPMFCQSSPKKTHEIKTILAWKGVFLWTVTTVSYVEELSCPSYEIDFNIDFNVMFLQISPNIRKSLERQLVKMPGYRMCYRLTQIWTTRAYLEKQILTISSLWRGFMWKDW